MNSSKDSSEESELYMFAFLWVFDCGGGCSFFVAFFFQPLTLRYVESLRLSHSTLKQSFNVSDRYIPHVE